MEQWALRQMGTFTGNRILEVNCHIKKMIQARKYQVIRMEIRGHIGVERMSVSQGGPQYTWADFKQHPYCVQLLQAFFIVPTRATPLHLVVYLPFAMRYFSSPRLSPVGSPQPCACYASRS